MSNEISDLRRARRLQSRQRMKQPSLLLTVLLLLLAPGVAFAQHAREGDQDNVNARYVVEKVSIEGIDDSNVGKPLRADMQKLVGQKYDRAAVNDLAERLRKELRGYSVEVRVRRGEKTDHVKIAFNVERNESAFVVQAAPIIYHSQEAFSVVLGGAGETHHNYVSAKYANTNDDLLERNEGWRLRYEHRRVGTPMVQVGVGYDYFHPTFKAPTLTALAASPEVPGVYRVRDDFTPSVSVLPAYGVKLTAGVSLNNLDFDVPTPHTAHAFAFTFDAQVQRRIAAGGGYRHEVGVDYSLRRSTPSLESDFDYTRHLVAGDYSLSNRRHLFGFHGRLGTIDGAAPLFERFSIGNSFLLRGWDKFVVAPIGGSRLAHGSLEYRYRSFQIFWDFGSVWDANQTARVHHSVGVGLVSRNTRVGGWFVTLAFPVRLNDVGPVIMFGVRR
jgi:Omp85 superfamily domain